MSCIMNGCWVAFGNESDGQMYVCDAYRICDAFVFRFNPNLFYHGVEITTDHKPDCIIDRDSDLFCFDRLDDLAIIVVDEMLVKELSDKLSKASDEYAREGMAALNLEMPKEE
jgi:hypothetical protein